jgi:hypothetical protein
MYYASSGLPLDGTGGQIVSESECFKALRSTELLAYRMVVRALEMQRSGVMNKRHARLLEELREHIDVSDTRHELELAAAAADSEIVTIQNSGVASRRSTFTDLLAEVPVPEVGLDPDDRGGLVVPPRFFFVFLLGDKHPQKRPPSRNEAVPTRVQPPPKSEHKAETTAVMSVLAELRVAVTATARAYVTEVDGARKVGLKMKLRDFEKKLDELENQLK